MKKIFLSIAAVFILSPINAYALIEKEVEDTEFSYVAVGDKDGNFLSREHGPELMVVATQLVDFFNVMIDEENETAILYPTDKNLIRELKKTIKDEELTEATQKYIDATMLIYDDHDNLPDSYRFAMLKPGFDKDEREATFDDFVFTIKDKKLEYTDFGGLVNN